MFKEVRRMGRAELEDEVLRLRERVASQGYIIEAMAPGWFCPNAACGVWNGDVKDFLVQCRVCNTDRPRHA